MNIFLTGSGGFIGKYLKRTLQEGYNLISPRSYELDLLRSASVREYIEKNKIDLVIHAVGCGMEQELKNSMEAAKKDIKMFENLSAACASGVRIITLGTGREYDRLRELKKVSEKEFGNFVPKDPFGYSKYTISKIIEGLEGAVNLRIFGLYGMHEHPSRHIPKILSSVLRGDSPVIENNIVQDLLYAEDLIKIVMFFVDNRVTAKFVNVTPTESISILEAAETAVKLSNSKARPILQSPKMDFEYTGANDLLLTLLGGFSFTSYKVGLEKYLKLYEEY